MALPKSENVEQRYLKLKNENLSLKEAIRKIEERLVCIEASLPKQKVIVLREISREQAKKEIKNLFNKGNILYYSDVAEQLQLDLQTVVEICNELQNKGEIETVGKN